MATDNLPLLHKYVINRDDDMQLQMTKLRYRLCVREVHDVILARQSGLTYSDLQPHLPIEEEIMTSVEAQPAYSEPSQYSDDMEEEEEEEDALSSLDYEEIPHKHGLPRLMTDDSGIGLDDSVLNQTQPEEMNGVCEEEEVVANGNISHEEKDAEILGKEVNGDIAVDTGGDGYNDTGVEEEDVENEEDDDDDTGYDMDHYRKYKDDDEEEELQVNEQNGEVEERIEEVVESQVEAVPTEGVDEVKQDLVESPAVEQCTEESTNMNTEVNAEISAEATESQATELKDTETVPESTETVPESTETVPKVTETVSETTEDTQETQPEQDEQVVPQEEEAKEEEKKEEKVEEPRVDYVMGTTCNDVWTAIDILKTRYRLSSNGSSDTLPRPTSKHTQSVKDNNDDNTEEECIEKTTAEHVESLPPESGDSYDSEIEDAQTTIKKCIITWSRWNVHDIVREPNESMPWWAKTREPEPVINEMDQVIDMACTIQNKESEIEELLQTVLDEERKKKAAEPKPEEDPSKTAAAPVCPDEVIECKEEPGLETIPEKEGDISDPEKDDEDDKPSKKKKGNIWQRMMRALRKRLSTRGSA